MQQKKKLLENRQNVEGEFKLEKFIGEFNIAHVEKSKTRNVKFSARKRRICWRSNLTSTNLELEDNIVDLGDQTIRRGWLDINERLTWPRRECSCRAYVLT